MKMIIEFKNGHIDTWGDTTPVFDLDPVRPVVFGMDECGDVGVDSIDLTLVRRVTWENEERPNVSDDSQAQR